MKEDLQEALRSRIAGEVRFDRASRLMYSTDASIYEIEPIGVVLPRTHEDVFAAMEITRDFGVPLLSRGGGTSLAGQTVGEAVVVHEFVAPHAAELRELLVERHTRQQRAEIHDGILTRGRRCVELCCVTA